MIWQWLLLTIIWLVLSTRMLERRVRQKRHLQNEKLQPGHLAAALDTAEQCGYHKTLAKLYPLAGPVISKNGSTF